MNVPLEWLQSFLPGPALDAQICADALTMGGLPVEHITAVGPDTVLDVEVTSNRSDCLSVYGVAAELAALLDRPLESLPTLPGPGGASEFAVTIQATDVCPHYTARLVRGVKVGPSPEWMRRRLEAIGCRSINNVVDVTNYVLFELGQPLHAFDAAKLSGRTIYVRRAMADEAFISLDGHARKLDAGMLVIADAARPVALAGVMGGLDTEVSAATTDVLLESARFEPLSIRSTARKLSMRSDSSYRYERGLDPTLVDRAGRRAVELLQQLASAAPEPGIAVAGAASESPRSLFMRLSRATRLLGYELSANDVVKAFRRQGMNPRLSGDLLTVDPPSRRLDLRIEEDLIEEAARVIGYDRIPTRDAIEIRLQPINTTRVATTLLRTTLAGAGFFEAVTFSFASDAIAAAFLPAGATLQEAEPIARKADAKLRPSVLPGLLESLARNEAAGNGNVKLFEIGAAFQIIDNAMTETQRVAGVGPDDYRAIRGTVETLLNRLDPKRDVTVEPADAHGFAPGAAGRVLWDGEPVGHIGRVDRAVAARLGMRYLPVAFELLLQPLLAGYAAVPQLVPLPKFPAVSRDLSLIVPDATPYAAIESSLRSAAGESLESIRYVTTYRGKPIEAGKKSVTVALSFRSPTNTLTTEAVDADVAKLTAAAKEKLGAILAGAS
jgi:phenylalanyl-tRNA synthetase beta chain